MWFDILKSTRMLEFWVRGKKNNSIEAIIPHKGFLPKDQISYARNYWAENYNEIKNKLYQIPGEFELKLTNVEILETSEEEFSWGLDANFKEIKEPAQVQLDNWLRVRYYCDIIIDLDEQELMDSIEEDDFTAKFR